MSVSPKLIQRLNEQASAGDIQATIIRDHENRIRQAELSSGLFAQPNNLVGDGIADDTEAIRNALTANAGGTVFLRAGTYLVSSTISIPDSTRLLGEGPSSGVGSGGTKLVRSGADCSILSLGEGSQLDGVWLAHIGGTEPTSGALLNYTKTVNSWTPTWRGLTKVSNIRLTDGYDGFNIAGFAPPEGATVVQLYLSEFVIQRCRRYNVRLVNVADAQIQRGWIDGHFDGNRIGTGMLFSGWNEGVEVRGVKVVNTQYGIDIAGVSASQWERVGFNKFIGVFVDGSSLIGVRMNYAYVTEFTNCWVAGTLNTGNGYDIGNSFDITINGGTVFSNSGSGVHVFNTSKHVRVSGTTLAGNAFYGFLADADTSYFSVQGCSVHGGVLPYNAATQMFGITVANGTSDHYIIADNMLEGNSSAGVEDGGSGVNKRVANNV